MSEYLTPEEVEDAIDLMVDMGWPKTADTLREMAAIVAAVAEMEPVLHQPGPPHIAICAFCGYYGPLDADMTDITHKPDCAYLRARKLMGHAE